jgi:hypothetical protein
VQDVFIKLLIMSDLFVCIAVKLQNLSTPVAFWRH